MSTAKGVEVADDRNVATILHNLKRADIDPLPPPPNLETPTLNFHASIGRSSGIKRQECVGEIDSNFLKIGFQNPHSSFFEMKEEIHI